MDIPGTAGGAMGGWLSRTEYKSSSVSSSSPGPGATIQAIGMHAIAHAQKNKQNLKEIIASLLVLSHVPFKAPKLSWGLNLFVGEVRGVTTGLRTGGSAAMELSLLKLSLLQLSLLSLLSLNPLKLLNRRGRSLFERLTERSNWKRFDERLT